MIEKSFRKIADEVYTHKEYHPIINHRVFSLKEDQQKDGYGGMKDILNIQFKETYTKFLYFSIHQMEAKLPPKLQIELAYFLQLQDRVDEAIRVFEQVDLASLQQEDMTAQIAYDYMRAYFEFYKVSD